MAATVTMAGLAAGLPSGEDVFGPVTMTGTSVVPGGWGGTLAVGDNVIPVPAGSTPTWAWLFLGVGGVAATIKLRTNLNSTDAGLRIAPFSNVGCAVFPLPAGTTQLILNASASVAAISVKFG